MIDLGLDMEQYDCPFIDTSTDHDVAFTAFHWGFDESTRELETRMVVEAGGRDHLESGLTALREHDNMHEYALLQSRGDEAHIRTVIDETDAMATIRAHGGYITGPFSIEAGSEEWHIGFDSGEVADEMLSELDRHNEFTVARRDRHSLADLQSLVDHAGPALQLFESCRTLTGVERDTLRTAVEMGYFDEPRGVTQGALADEFGVSTPAVSKTLRRGQRKLMTDVVDVLEDIESP